MNLKETFTQEDLHLILPSKIALAIDQIAAETGEDPVELLPKFYASEVYAKLKDESTKYWWFGPAELKELYLRERASGNTQIIGPKFTSDRS